jgi:ABC-type Fe3+-siderophore transport system permease subunit
MSEKSQNLLFILSLFGVMAMIYRGRMAYDQPQGSCLFAWRLAFLGAAIFLSTVAGIVWQDRVGVSTNMVWLVPLAIGVVLVFVGIIIWSTNSCGKKK